MDYSLLIGIHDTTKVSSVDDNSRLENAEGSPRQRTASSGNENEAGFSDRPDSDQDNFSPAEDAYDTDDGQLNRNKYQ